MWFSSVHEQHDRFQYGRIRHSCTRSVQPYFPPLQFVARTIGLLSAAGRVGHRNSRVSADLLSPGGRRSTSGTPPVGTWPDTVLCFATGLKGRIFWYIVSKPGNMTEQSETSFANNGRSCQQTSATQNFVVRYVVVPSDVEDVEDPPLTPYVERLQSPPVQLRKGPRFRAVEVYRQHASQIYADFR